MNNYRNDLLSLRTIERKDVREMIDVSIHVVVHTHTPRPLLSVRSGETATYYQKQGRKDR
jgi:hypothetical protein